MDEAGVRKVIAENNRALLVEIKDLVNSSISDLKRSNESIASEQMSEIKRLKRDSAPQFNKKSNEEQYKANKAIKDAVEDAQIALQRNDVEKTKQALDKGMELLQERQKLILLADKSQYGWKTVLEYKHHDLADDEEDEKKICRAESRAARSTKRFTSRPIRQRSNVPFDFNNCAAFRLTINQFVFAYKPAVFVSEIGIWFVLCLWQTRALEGFLS